MSLRQADELPPVRCKQFAIWRALLLPPHSLSEDMPWQRVSAIITYLGKVGEASRHTWEGKYAFQSYGRYDAKARTSSWHLSRCGALYEAVLYLSRGTAVPLSHKACELHSLPICRTSLDIPF